DDIGREGIHGYIERILRSLAECYAAMRLASGEWPFSIYVPVIEDTDDRRLARFRAVLDVDETMRPKSSDYLKYWGLWYDFDRHFRVFDVQQRLLLDESYMTRDRHWKAWHERWQRE